MNTSQNARSDSVTRRYGDDQLITLANLLLREKIRLETLIGVLDELRATDTDADISLGLVPGSIRAARDESGLSYKAETRRYGIPELEEKVLKKCRLQKFYYSPWR